MFITLRLQFSFCSFSNNVCIVLFKIDKWLFSIEMLSKDDIWSGRRKKNSYIKKIDKDFSNFSLDILTKMIYSFWEVTCLMET